MADEQGPQFGETIHILDATGMIHALYHAVPIETTRSLSCDQPLNAVIGWVRSLRRLRANGARYIVPVFDGEGRGWRNDLLAEYKADRKPTEEDLLRQMPLVRELTAALRLPVACMPAVEADDLIASYVEAAVASELAVTVISSDKDLMQLVRDGDRGSVRQLVPGKYGGVFGPAEVRTKFGVGPERLGDLLALAGDKVDGIPGIRGIGPKTAATLLGDGDLELLLSRWSFIAPSKLGDTVHRLEAKLRLWRRVIDLDRGLELPVPLDRLQPWTPSRRALDEFFGRFGFPRWESAVDRYEE
jgi:DNA polymerase-1